MNPKTLRKLSFVLRWGIASFLAFGLSHGLMPMAHAQLPNLWNLSGSSTPQPTIDYVQRGNIHIADVRLDGVPLFKVAAPAASNDIDDRRNILPIEWRVNEIEIGLARIVDGGFEPDTLEVTVQTLNSQTVIIAADRNWTQPIVTVTELDRQIDGTSNSISEIAQIRAQKLETALLEAHRQRQPEYFRQHLFYLVLVLAVVAILSLTILKLQIRLQQKWRKLKQENPDDRASDTRSDTIQPNTTEEFTGFPPFEPQSNAASESMSESMESTPEPESPQLTIAKRKNINQTLQFFLWWGQIILWLAGSIIALVLFPQTRGVGVWLIGVPISFISILLGLTVTSKIIDILVLYGLGKWAESEASNDSTNEQINGRVALRIPVINDVYRTAMRYVVIVLGILMFLDAIKAPLTLVLVGIGIVGFSIQNLIKDWIGGFLVLWEDQYTQGDVVKINGLAGAVESFNLRTTQLRNLDGEMITIANGSFTTAINLTYQWSRLNLGIDVAYSTDLARAITVMEEVAEKIYYDPAWRESIAEPPTILGVDAFGDNSITIRLLIKTQPMKQWDVGREYRRRLKQAFDLADITIPFPQRSIWFEGISKDV